MSLGFETRQPFSIASNSFEPCRSGPSAPDPQPLTMPPAADSRNVELSMNASAGSQPRKSNASLSLGPQPKPFVADSPPPYSMVTWLSTLPLAGATSHQT